MMGIIAALSGEAEVEAKAKKAVHEQTAFQAKDLPVVLPSEYQKFSPEQRSAMTSEIISLLATSSGEAAQEAWKKLPLTTRETLSRTVFEEGRLTGNATRGALLKYGVLLDTNLQVAFNGYADKLKKVGLPVPNYNELTAALTTKKPADLKKFYDVLTSTLRTKDAPTKEVVSPKPLLTETSLETRGNQRDSTKPEAIDIPKEKKVVIPAEFANYINRDSRREKDFPGVFFIKGTVKEYKEHPTLALTFDDGPDTVYTPQVLRILAEKGVRATFYVQGEFLTKKHQGVLNDILTAGNELALHSFDHTPLNKHTEPPEEVFKKQVVDTAERLRSLTTTPERPNGYSTNLYRPAFGNITDAQINYFGQQKMKVVNWSIDTEDWKKGEPGFMSRLVGDGAIGGDIALMHSGGGKRDRTIAELPAMIDRLKQRGIVFVTTSEILGAVPVDEEKISINKKIEKVAPLPENQLLVPTPETPTATTPVDAGTSPSLDQGERTEKVLPPGADAFDKDGYPYGWAFQNYPLYEGDVQPPIPDLVSTTPPGEQPIGLTRSGERKEFSLRKDAFEAFMALRGRLNREGSPEAKTLGLFITEGYRTLANQIETKKKYPTKAALPRTSEHELGIAIDITNGQITPLYNYLYGIGKNELPPIIAAGFIPTALNEPWHARFVGSEAAATYWKKHKTKILDIHTRLRRNEAIVISKN